GGRGANRAGDGGTVGAADVGPRPGKRTGTRANTGPVGWTMPQKVAAMATLHKYIWAITISGANLRGSGDPQGATFAKREDSRLHPGARAEHRHQRPAGHGPECRFCGEESAQHAGTGTADRARGSHQE